MERRLKGCKALRGEVTPPGDKSISHRALLLNGIADGRARVGNLAPGADLDSMMACLRALGVDIIEQAGSVTVCGVGMGGLKEAADVLDAGNSATVIRLLAGLLSAQPFLTIVTGDESLRARPMERVVQPLRLMGAQIWGRGGDSLAPLAIRGGGLSGIEYRLPVASAQIKTAILIAALFAAGGTVVSGPAPSRDHTERLLQAMGVEVRGEGDTVEIAPCASLAPVDVDVPGDISAAAFWLVAAAVHPDARIKIVNVGVNPTRSGIIDVLRSMGARLSLERQHERGGEPVADISVESSQLTGTQVDGALVPRLIDELPLVALAAAFATGTTTIRDAAELRVKESDRIGNTVRELSRLGADIEELPDGMVIRGSGRLSGAQCDSHGDHRLAMTLGAAALVARGETAIRGAEAVSVSYPDFWQDLERLAQR